EQDEVDVAAQDADEADAPTRRARAHRAWGRRRTREGASVDAVGRMEGVGVAPGVLRDQLRAHGQHRRRPARELELLRSIERIEAVVDEGANARALEVREAAREVGDPAERAADLPPVELGAELRPEAPERQLAERPEATERSAARPDDRDGRRGNGGGSPPSPLREREVGIARAPGRRLLGEHDRNARRELPCDVVRCLPRAIPGEGRDDRHAVEFRRRLHGDRDHLTPSSGRTGEFVAKILQALESPMTADTVPTETAADNPPAETHY